MVNVFSTIICTLSFKLTWEKSERGEREEGEEAYWKIQIAKEKRKEKEAQGSHDGKRIIETLTKDSQDKLNERTKEAIGEILVQIESSTLETKEEKPKESPAEKKPVAEKETEAPAASAHDAKEKEAKASPVSVEINERESEKLLEEEEAHIKKDSEIKKEAEEIAKSDEIKRSEATRQEERRENDIKAS